jgi:hypothetical protein
MASEHRTWTSELQPTLQSLFGQGQGQVTWDFTWHNDMYFKICSEICTQFYVCVLNSLHHTVTNIRQNLLVRDITWYSHLLQQVTKITHLILLLRYYLLFHVIFRPDSFSPKNDFLAANISVHHIPNAWPDCVAKCRFGFFVRIYL